MSAFPLADVRRHAARLVGLDWESPSGDDPDPPSPWANSSVLAGAYSFSFADQKCLPFDPPVLAACPPKGTELKSGSRKDPLFYKHVWAQQEAGMRALVESPKSGIVQKATGSNALVESPKSGIVKEATSDDEVVFVGNVGRLIDACQRNNGLKDTVVCHFLRVNNIVHFVSRETERKATYWGAGTELERLWTTNCDKNVGNYVFFRGKMGENTVLVPSQVDAVREKGSSMLVEIKLGRVKNSHQAFTQCHFKGLHAIDFVEVARACKFFQNANCRNGRSCEFKHSCPKTASGALSLNVDEFRPAFFGRSVLSVDRLFTKLKELLEIGKSSVLVIEDGKMTLFSQITNFESPWLFVPPFFGQLYFKNSH